MPGTWHNLPILNGGDGATANNGGFLLNNASTTDFTFQIGAGTAGADNVTVSNGEIDSYSLFFYNSDNPNANGASVGNDSASSSANMLIYIDLAMVQINKQRSELGAVSNRLNHTVNNLTNISTNLSAARGGIEDADFALETTELAKTKSCSRHRPLCWRRQMPPSKTFSVY